MGRCKHIENCSLHCRANNLLVGLLTSTCRTYMWSLSVQQRQGDVRDTCRTREAGSLLA